MSVSRRPRLSLTPGFKVTDSGYAAARGSWFTAASIASAMVLNG